MLMLAMMRRTAVRSKSREMIVATRRSALHLPQ
jgi:hypothetical protein